MQKWLIIKFFLLTAPCAVFLTELAFVRRFVRPGRRLRNAFAAIGLLGAAKFAGFSAFGGDAFNPELPFAVIVAWGWLESAVWVGLPVGFLATLLALAVKPFRRWAFPSALALSLLGATWGMWEGVRVPPVVEREVVVEGLPSEFDGYRLAHLSDLHCSSAARRDKIAAIVGRTNAARPDLIAITGDFVDGFPSARREDLAPLADLRAKDGVVASAGNHEGYFHVDDWMPLYRQWGVRMLRNEWMEIRRGGASLAVGGEDDEVLGGTPLNMLRPAASSGGETSTNVCRILMRHRPVFCEFSEARLGVRLQLSGHTHGGAMPLIASFVASCNEGHVSGFYRIGRLVLHVSPGTGQWAGFPLRFFNSPEITILVLRTHA